MNAAFVSAYVNVSMVLGLATMLGMVATMLTRKADSLARLALTMTTGLGFLLSLVILMGAAR